MKTFAATILLLGTFLVTTTNLVAQETKPEAFLKKTRDLLSPTKECWVSLSGQAVHKKGRKYTKAPIYLGVRFLPEKVIAQVLINKNEGYLVTQKLKAGNEVANVVKQHKDLEKEMLTSFKLNPEDLTLSFLYWNFVKELPKEKVKSYECRVLILESPDKTAKVRVNISSEHHFPLRVQWLDIKDESPTRKFEVKSFRKQDNYWLITTLELEGKGWRTKIQFKDTKAGEAKDRPEKLFRDIEE